jgi:NADH:ubiquinone oxidoreductase subunit 3 (subunit A)
MNDPRNKSNPTTRVAAIIVVAVLIALATLVYNALKGKHEYDAEKASAPASGASIGAASSAAAPAGASQ